MTDAASSPRRAALIYNPVKADGPRLCHAVTALSHEYGWDEPLFLETSTDDAGQGRTREALASGVGAVVVAGGDGTVRAVAEVMGDTGVALAIVPSGTGNLFARNLHLPLDDPERIIRAAFEGRTAAIDLGWAELTQEDGSSSEHAFVVLAGMGLDAYMIANTRADLKKSVGWVAYIDGAARSLPAAKPFRIVYQVEEHRLHSTKVHSMLFANCGSLPAGIELLPDASITDGELDIALIQPRGPLGWLAVWRTVWWQNSVLRRTRTGRRMLEFARRDQSVRFLRGRSAEAAAAAPTPIELDGDEFGTAMRIRCRIAEGALLIVVPEGATTPVGD
ncbi:diacylglycerol/lipid kinase family protein [Microbacterium sp. YY-01]|uniref:diacylglycerol/lipid kinase family protein n=1 Tax=Microbacterium sp. YY-01 TaxID=3421634 RepID=UPI003D1647AF